LSATRPVQEELIVTIQRFLSLDKDDREKLHNLLYALDKIQEPSKTAMPPIAPAIGTSAPEAVPPDFPQVLTPSSSSNTPTKPMLNPEAPAFRDLSKLKSTISLKNNGRKAQTPIKASYAKVASTSTKTVLSLAKAVPQDAPSLKWKMSPEKTWRPSVHQRLAETRQNRRSDYGSRVRSELRSHLKLKIPVETTTSIPTFV